MLLLPIDLNEAKNSRFFKNPDCLSILKVYPDYYKKVGFHKPWIGYFGSIDGEEIVGAAGFKWPPREGRVEIAYGTFKEYEGKGIGTELCRQLVRLALQENPDIKVMARTLQDGHASMAILRKNGFQCLGLIYDEEDGDVYEWEFMPQQVSSLH